MRSALVSIPYAEVIGDPIAHSKSPLIHNFWLEKLGIEGDYRKAHIRAEGLAEYLVSRRTDEEWRGCNVTIPHKRAVMPLLDDLMLEAREIGAVNTIVRLCDPDRLIGINTDYLGVVLALADLDTTRAACLIGAGGAARSAMEALELRRIEHVNLIVRDQTAGDAMLDAFALSGRSFGFDQAGKALSECGAVINASPLGMIDAPLMPESVLLGLSGTTADALIFDMVYSPLETELLRRARTLGRRTADGLEMLIGQAAVAFHHFFGQPAPREHDAELRALLTR